MPGPTSQQQFEIVPACDFFQDAFGDSVRCAYFGVQGDVLRAHIGRHLP